MEKDRWGGVGEVRSGGVEEGWRGGVEGGGGEL